MSKWPGFDLHAELIADVERRFWLQVLKTDGCWLWTGATNEGGYGIFAIADRERPASVVSWALVNGPIPAMGLICHHCDNPPCVRPSHLFLGDHSINRLDAEIKAADPSLQVSDMATLTTKLIELRMDKIRGRHRASRVARMDARRARQSATRRANEQVLPSLASPMNFSDDEIRQIRAVPDGKGVNSALARQFHVSRQAIAAIRKRETYRNVSDLSGPDLTRKEDAS